MMSTCEYLQATIFLLLLPISTVDLLHPGKMQISSKEQIGSTDYSMLT